ncbi:MAG: secondary thiamine-phosphate synthase enzyme YjbQ [Anaerolineales bacterium]|nr:secondary thiamine-phosphate synthase enzyme YjbQ [Anaerolineales bacterium]
MVHSHILKLSTSGQAEVHDITDGVRAAIEQSGIRDGIACVFTASSTSGLTTLEFEPGAVEDLRRALDRLAPPEAEYLHNQRWGDGNGHAHLRAALLGPSLSLPVVEGRPLLGTWQQVIFIDFDVRPRRREIRVQVVGDPE